MTTKRVLYLLLAVFLIACCFAGCGKQPAGQTGAHPAEMTTLSDLSNKKIGIVTGTMTALLVPKLVPDAHYIEFNSTADVIIALESGKIDAFPTDESIYLAMLWEGNSVDRVAEALACSDYGILFGKGKNLPLQQQVNAYIAKIREDGRFNALQEKWFGDSEPKEFVSYDNLTG